MKKLILMVSAIAFFGNIGSAQTTSDNETDFRAKLLFGGKIGINYSNVYNSQTGEFYADSKVGLAAGGFVCIPIGKFFGIQPEVMYSQKGFRATGVILGKTYSLTRTTDYLDIPLLAAVKPSEFITLVAGPQFSYLLRQKDAFGTATTTIEQQVEITKYNIRKNTLCFTAGVDLTLKRMLLSARAGWDLQRNNGDGTSTAPRYKNMWYQGTVGYRF